MRRYFKTACYDSLLGPTTDLWLMTFVYTTYGCFTYIRRSHSHCATADIKEKKQVFLEKCKKLKMCPSFYFRQSDPKTRKARSSATAEKQRVSCARLLSRLANWSCNAQITAKSQMLYNAIVECFPKRTKKWKCVSFTPSIHPSVRPSFYFRL